MNKISIFLCLLLFAANSYSQQSFTIKVITEKGEAIPGVVVSNNNIFALGITNDAGSFSFTHTTDSIILTLTATDYITNRSLVVKNIYREIILTKKTLEKAEETVTVFGRKSTVVNAAAAVAIINKSSLNKYDQQSFTAAFNTVPGVKMDERSPGSYRLNIRGNLLRSTFGVRNVKMYLNELPITDASGNTYFNQLAPALLGTIQIIKGPGGSMYGAGTGGVVLMRNDAMQKPGTDLSITGGSYGLFTASATNHFSIKKTNSAFTLAHQQDDGYREHSAMRRDVAGYTVAYKPNDKHTLTATTYYSNLFYQTPGGLTASQVVENPKQARPPTTLFRSAVAQKAAIYLSTIYASLADVIIINKYWKNTTGVYFSYTDFKNPAIRNYEKKFEKGAGARTVFNFEKNKLSASVGAELQHSFINTATHGNK
ncbi:MAG: TonB-dependent receptor plug domain-containing protein [Ferruginibacter sp.]|nr:TonB-dependent receptor plug domain-containing protein [Ferruginibacter sp.]